MPNTDQDNARLDLAQEGTDALPPQIRERGFTAIEAAASAVLGAFAEDSRHSPLGDSPEMKSLLHLLQGGAKNKKLCRQRSA